MDVKWHSPCEKLMKNKMVGTAINMLITSITAYALSKKYLPGRKVMMGVVIVFMLFNPGMIPNYLVVNDLHMLDTYWSLWLPIAISAYNMVIMKNFFQGLPDSIEESAQIDGCNDFRFFTMFVLPLSKAVIAVIAMQYAIGHWNSYFNAMIYLSDSSKYPLQIFLREILIMNDIDTSDIVDEELAIAMQGMADLLKYALIVVATAPILCIYPFVQKYFVKGVMMGSLKG